MRQKSREDSGEMQMEFPLVVGSATAAGGGGQAVARDRVIALLVAAGAGARNKIMNVT